MPTLTNYPKTETTLRLAARKSFSYGLLITDANGVALDITGTSIRFISKRPPFNPLDLSDDDNLVVNSMADLVTPTAGYAVFNFQASDLNHDEDVYPFVITLTDAGYSSPIVVGELEIVDNPDFDSSDDVYTPTDAPATVLQVWLQNRNVIKVSTGTIQAPGTVPFTNADKDKLDGLAQSDWDIDDSGQPGAILHRPLNRLVPNPAAPGMLLTSNGNTQGAFGWSVQAFELGEYADVDDPARPGYFIPPTGAFSILSAVGAANGAVPRANGADGWGWQILAMPTTLDQIADTATRLAMTPAERASLASLTGGTVTIGWSDITGKPAFGSASLQDVTYFRLAGGAIDAGDVTTGVLDKARVPMVSALNGWKHGTTVPTTSDIAPGEVWLKHS
jgi:hypothetical protein